MSACRSVTKYLSYFFKHEASDSKQEDPITTTQANPMIKQNKSMIDFVREYTWDVIEKRRYEQSVADEYSSADLLRHEETEFDALMELQR